MWEELGYKYLVTQSLGIVATCQDIVYLKKVNVGFHTYYLHLFVSAFFLSPNLCFFFVLFLFLFLWLLTSFHTLSIFKREIEEVGFWLVYVVSFKSRVRVSAVVLISLLLCVCVWKQGVICGWISDCGNDSSNTEVFLQHILSVPTCPLGFPGRVTVSSIFWYWVLTQRNLFTEKYLCWKE